MKRINRARKSLILSCAVYFAFFTFIIVLIYSVFHHLASQRINESVFTMEDLLSYENDLIDENYTRIPARNSKNSSMIIFDESGMIKYASNRTIREKVFFEDLDMIGDYNSGRFFDVFQDALVDGSIQYAVYLNAYDTEDDDKVPKTLDS